jgi:FMN phosphatase YigB (HAD superfamily)
MLHTKAIKKVVLVDFDGVVLKNKVADAKVAKRAGIYTWNRLNNLRPHNGLIGPKQGDDICFNLYKGYGHTLLGLKDIGIDSNMKDYNKVVYDTIDYSLVRESNNSFDEVRELINYCHECQYDIFMFSNAPYRWIENTLADDKDILLSMEDVRKVIGIDEDDDKFLKPQKHIYDVIDAYFNRENIVFVDDNIGNIRPVMDKLTWTNFVITTSNKKINNRLHFADGLHHVMEII